VEDYIEKTEPLGSRLLCRRITTDRDESGIVVPEVERQYSTRFLVVKPGSESIIKESDIVVRTLSASRGVPVTLKDIPHVILEERDLIYVEGGEHKGPVNGFTVLRSQKREKDEHGLIIPEENQDLEDSRCTVIETKFTQLKVGNTVHINKFSDNYERYPITVDGSDCFLFPDENILAKQ